MYALLVQSGFVGKDSLSKERMKKETHVMYMLICYLILDMVLFPCKKII